MAIARAFLSSDFNAENNPTAVADTDDVAKSTKTNSCFKKNIILIFLFVFKNKIDQSKLRKEFERFVTTLQEGLILNGQLIGSGKKKNRKKKLKKKTNSILFNLKNYF